MSIRLMREMRFTLAEPCSGDPGSRNSWAGVPASDRLDAYLALQAEVSGRVDPCTGYLCDIKELDGCLRRQAVPLLTGGDAGRRSVAAAMPELWSAVFRALPPAVRLETLTLRAGPQLSFTVCGGSPNMVRLTCAFEFSAAHRLHCSSMTADENRRLFGKCANPNGHGHNYVVEVTVRGTPDPTSGVVVSLGELTRAVNERVIERFDHKHLNLDCPEFAAVNPSVENIARVVFEGLEGAFRPAELDAVRVYETPKTWAECRRGA